MVDTHVGVSQFPPGDEDNNMGQGRTSLNDLIGSSDPASFDTFSTRLCERIVN